MNILFMLISEFFAIPLNYAPKGSASFFHPDCSPVQHQLLSPSWQNLPWPSDSGKSVCEIGICWQRKLPWKIHSRRSFSHHTKLHSQGDIIPSPHFSSIHTVWPRRLLWEGGERKRVGGSLEGSRTWEPDTEVDLVKIIRKPRPFDVGVYATYFSCSVFFCFTLILC